MVRRFVEDHKSNKRKGEITAIDHKIVVAGLISYLVRWLELRGVDSWLTESHRR